MNEEKQHLFKVYFKLNDRLGMNFAAAESWTVVVVASDEVFAINKAKKTNKGTGPYIFDKIEYICELDKVVYE